MPPRLLCIGEILWDQYPDRRLLGGAPFNLAAHAARLGFASYFISAVGQDEPGEVALAQASSLGVDMSFTRRHPALATGIVDVTLTGGQPAYHLRRPAAWEEPALSPSQLERIHGLRPDWLVCGTLQQTCPLARAARLALGDLPLFYDVNLRPGFEDRETVDELLHAATVVKCNDVELDWLARTFDLGSSPEAALIRRYGLAMLCITLGAEGCSIHAGGDVIRERPPLVKVEDAVGAGDAFSAAVLFGLTHNWPIRRTAQFANALGALVASRAGAIPNWTIEEVYTAANLQ